MIKCIEGTFKNVWWLGLCHISKTTRRLMCARTCAAQNAIFVQRLRRRRNSIQEDSMCVCVYIYYICTYILVINFQENFGLRLCEELESRIRSNHRWTWSISCMREIYISPARLWFSYLFDSDVHGHKKFSGSGKLFSRGWKEYDLLYTDWSNDGAL